MTLATIQDDHKQGFRQHADTLLALTQEAQALQAQQRALDTARLALLERVNVASKAAGAHADSVYTHLAAGSADTDQQRALQALREPQSEAVKHLRAALGTSLGLAQARLDIPARHVSPAPAEGGQ